MKERETIITILKTPIRDQEKDKLIGKIVNTMTPTQFSSFISQWIKDVSFKGVIYDEKKNG